MPALPGGAAGRRFSYPHVEEAIHQGSKDMSKATILLQLDGDPQASVFDGVVAVDSGIDFLFRHGGVTPEGVRDLVHGTMFTRGGDDLKHTAIFVGGSDVAAGEKLLKAVKSSFFGPVRVSVMFDANGCNTTAAAAVLAASRHVPLEGATATVLAGTGPVGLRAARLLAREGAKVKVGSRTAKKAAAACDALAGQVEGGEFEQVEAGTPEQAETAIEGSGIVIAAGAAGIKLLSAQGRRASDDLQVAIDLNAVPPAGIEGIEVTDKAAERDGALCYGALGVGGTKMKIHKAALAQLFERNDLVLDAEEIFQIGQELV